MTAPTTTPSRYWICSTDTTFPPRSSSSGREFPVTPICCAAWFATGTTSAAHAPCSGAEGVERFYRRSGVEVVREQLEHALAGDDKPPPYDLSDEGLLVWPGHGYQTEAVYDLRGPFLTPKMRGAPWNGQLPSLAGRHALYFREALAWATWTSAWERLARGEPPTRIAIGPSLIRSPASHTAALAG